MLFLRDSVFQEPLEVLGSSKRLCVCNVLTFFRATICFKSLVWKFLYTIIFSYCIPASDDNFRVGRVLCHFLVLNRNVVSPSGRETRRTAVHHTFTLVRIYSTLLCH